MVTEFGDDAHSSMSAADVGTVLDIAHTARFDSVWIAGGVGGRRGGWASDPDPLAAPRPVGGGQLGQRWYVHDRRSLRRLRPNPYEIGVLL
jgi:hypothetical protein